MPLINDITDGGPNPGFPTIEEMRESQRKGSVGIGLASEDYAQQQACFNMGTGTGEGSPADE